MLVYSLLIGCNSEPDAPPPTPGRERKHHVEGPPSPSDAAEAGGDDEGRSFGGGNREPKVRKLTISPTTPSRLSTMKVNVNATDPEGEPLEYGYHWKVNGSEVFGHDSPELELADYERGSTVEVLVTVSDGTNEIKGQSEVYTLGNADPQMVSVPGPKEGFDGVHLVAADPDGDDVKWHLEGAPPGATVDARGYLHYVGSEGDKGGKFTVKVVAEDGKGGKATLELPLEISPGSKGKPPPPGVPVATP